MKVVVTGGGTGGHIYPALAVADAIKRLEPDTDVRFVGARDAMEANVVPPTGLPFYGVTARKLRRVASPDTVLVALSLYKGYREAARYLRDFRPDVVISTGGYVAAATVIAAAKLRIPTVVQEHNAVAGRTNLWLERWATRVCVWFDETARAFPAAKVVKTGAPIREDVVAQTTQQQARIALGLAPDRFTVLVLGGSQGAQRVNEIVLAMLGQIDGPLQVLHQTGARNIEQVQTAAGLLSLHPDVTYHPRAYLEADQVAEAYRAADLVICRCGVSTLAEVAANGLPALMIPLPTAYADHQTANARALESAGGGRLLPQPTLTPEVLMFNVVELRDNPELRAKIGAAGAGIGRPDAARRVAQIAFEVAENRG